MPNWCENNLIVEGPPKAVRAFVECVKDGENSELSFERLVPTPPASLDDEVARELGRTSAGDPQQNNQPDWYHWRIKHWGTKWDANAVRVVEHQPDEGRIEYGFDTAWAPPESWLRTVAEMFPTLRFTLRYVEETMDFAGVIVCRGAEAVEREVPVPDFTNEQRENGEGFWATDIEIPDN